MQFLILKCAIFCQNKKGSFLYGVLYESSLKPQVLANFIYQIEYVCPLSEKVKRLSLRYFIICSCIFFQTVKIPLFQHDEEKYSPTTVRCNIGLRYSTKNRDIEIILENFNVSVSS